MNLHDISLLDISVSSSRLDSLLRWFKFLWPATCCANTMIKSLLALRGKVTVPHMRPAAVWSFSKHHFSSCSCYWYHFISNDYHFEGLFTDGNVSHNYSPVISHIFYTDGDVTNMVILYVI